MSSKIEPMLEVALRAILELLCAGRHRHAARLLAELLQAPEPPRSKGALRWEATKLRMDVFRRDAMACAYCRRKINLSDAHIDHVVPLSQGGSNDLSNLATACRDCNLSKGARTPEEWRQ